MKELSYCVDDVSLISLHSIIFGDFDLPSTDWSNVRYVRMQGGSVPFSTVESIMVYVCLALHR